MSIDEIARAELMFRSTPLDLPCQKTHRSVQLIAKRLPIRGTVEGDGDADTSVVGMSSELHHFFFFFAPLAFMASWAPVANSS